MTYTKNNLQTGAVISKSSLDNTETWIANADALITAQAATIASLQSTITSLLTTSVVLTNTVAPTISGSATVGSVITATTGSWSAAPDSYTYQWNRSNAPISGATSSTYTITQADVTNPITVSVTAAKANYTAATATSSAINATNGTLANTVLPTVTGTLTVGSVLSTSPGTWNPGADSYTYQWTRGGTSISGATSSSYTLVTADSGQSIRVIVTAVKSGYSTATATSAASTISGAATLANSTLPVINGNPQVGSALTVSTGSWTLTPDSYTYQWKRGGTAISGATTSSYTLVTGDSGSTLTVDVTAVKSGQTSVTVTAGPTTTITTPSGTSTGNVSYTAPTGTTTIGSSPLDTTANTFATGTSIVAKPALLSGFSGPLPTNAWWTNLFMGANPVAPLPYAVRPSTVGLDVCFPSNHIVSATAEYTAFVANMSLTAVETVNAYTITAYDDLTVTLKWPTNNANVNLQSCIAQGAGLIAMQYKGLTPTILTTGAAILTVNGAAPGSNVTGTSFQLVLNSGLTWNVYSSSSITFTTSTSNGMTATAAFTGTIQIGILPSTASSSSALDSSGGVWITGGNVVQQVASGVGTIQFNYTTSGSGTLLTYALPHHIDSMTSGTQASGYTLKTIKGSAQGITGTSWTLTETLPTIQFAPPRALDSTKNSALLTSLATDINSAYSLIVSDPYFTGKYLARWARLAQIADELGQPALAATARAKYKPDLVAWLTGANSADPLVYDTTWKGIISTLGTQSTGGDFGNGIYNDHHFHYGYFTYAAAVLAKTDSAFVSSYGTRVLELIRDYANPSAADTFSTKFRMKDLYAGHSWAQGLDNTGDPKDLESTSESINGYYAMTLWGQVTGNNQCALTGQLLLATEIRSAKKYWHIKAADTIYSSSFAANKVAGIVWGSKVDYATFFSGAAECIHGIQMIPFTPITENYLTSDWVTEEYPVVRQASFGRTFPISGILLTGGSGYVGQFTSPTGQAYSNYISASGGTGSGLQFNVNITGGTVIEVFVCTDQHGSGYTDGDVITLNGSGGTGCTIQLQVAPANGWATFLYGDQAVIDKATAWTNLSAYDNSLASWDDGNSKTNMLHWVASRP